MLFTFVLLLTLWIFGGAFGVHPTVAAFLGISILLATGIIKWDDVLQEKNAWNTFIWLATIVMLSKYLTVLGMIGWFTDNVSSYANALSWQYALIVLGLVYFYSHYLFGSMTAHITAMYSAFLLVLIAAGAPPMYAALLLAFLSSLSAGTTHYGTGTAPVYFESNYLTMPEWWRIGAVVAIVNLIIWGVVGSLWWKQLGIW